MKERELSSANAALEETIKSSDAVCDSYAKENQRLHDRAIAAEAALEEVRRQAQLRASDPLRANHGCGWVNATADPESEPITHCEMWKQRALAAERERDEYKEHAARRLQDKGDLLDRQIVLENQLAAAESSLEETRRELQEARGGLFRLSTYTAQFDLGDREGGTEEAVDNIITGLERLKRRAEAAESSLTQERADAERMREALRGVIADCGVDWETAKSQDRERTELERSVAHEMMGILYDRIEMLAGGGEEDKEEHARLVELYHKARRLFPVVLKPRNAD